jgi:hypothetical protein
MSIEDRLTVILEEVEPLWREDFVRLVADQSPSLGFLRHFESNISCQRAFDIALRTLDANWVVGLKATSKTVMLSRQ